MLTVSGIGAKVALSIVASIAPPEFARAVANQDVKTLTRLPTVGKKSAERLILELRGKLTEAPAQVVMASQTEAADALEALGYTDAEIAQALKSAPSTASTEQLIKEVKRMHRLVNTYELDSIRLRLRAPESELIEFQKLAEEFFGELATDYRLDSIWNDEGLGCSNGEAVYEGVFDFYLDVYPQDHREIIWAVKGFCRDMKIKYDVLFDFALEISEVDRELDDW